MVLEAMLSALPVALKATGHAVLGLIILQVFFALGADLYQRWRLRGLPGPPAAPFLGNLLQILTQGSPTFFRECRAKYGPVFKVAFGRSWMVVVADPDLLRQVGSKLPNHSMFRGLLKGDFAKLDEFGLVAARDDFWRLARAAWQPAFSSASLSGYLPRMVHCAGLLVGKLEERARRQQQLQQEGGTEGEKKMAGKEVVRVDMWRELGAMTLQVVGSTAYGVDFHAMDYADDSSAVAASDADTDFVTAAAAITAAAAMPAPSSYGRVLVEACRDVFRYSSIAYGTKYSRVGLLFPEWRPLVRVVAHALPDMPFRKLLQARGHLRDACFTLISAWRSSAANGATAATAAKDGNGNGATANGDHVANGTTANGGNQQQQQPAVASGSFLGLMLSARDKATGEGLTDLQVAAQVQTFILAGYETTANALAFAVYCIATNPQAEERLLAEIDSVLGPDRPPSESDLPLLPYTEAVFNEAMRLFPPAHGTNRHSDKGPVQVGGFTIPPDMPIFMSIFSAHTNTDVWPRAAEFIPERFLPSSALYGEVAARVPHAHSPFGYGSRMCVGWKFAVQEAKVALARLYQRLRFELEPGQVPLATAAGITLSPKHGVWVRPVLRR